MLEARLQEKISETREQAIRTYVERLSKRELVALMHYMNAHDGCFKDFVYYDMGRFNELMSTDTPMEIAQLICFGDGFDPNDDYFRFDVHGNLESGTWQDIEALAEDSVDDIIYHLVNSYSGETPWGTLDDIISADDDARFIDFRKLIEEEEG